MARMLPVEGRRLQFHRCPCRRTPISPHQTNQIATYAPTVYRQRYLHATSDRRGMIAEAYNTAADKLVLQSPSYIRLAP